MSRLPRHAALAALLLVDTVGCTPTRWRLAPQRDDPALAGAAAERADAACRAAGHPLPPHPFTSDGCSLWPDGDWSACCLAHDAAYWCGGSAAERAEADRALARCVETQGHARLGPWMHAGVRAGGGSWTGMPFRWGYGWGCRRGRSAGGS